MKSARPARIVYTDARNEFARSVFAVPATPNLRPSSTHVALPAGLPEDSMARCENVSSLHQSRLTHGPLGATVDSDSIRKVEGCLIRSLVIAA